MNPDLPIDATALRAALVESGVTDVAYFPGPELQHAYEDIEVAHEIAAAIS